MTHLLIMSMAGGAAGLILLLIKPVTKKLFGYKWQYYIWLVPLLTFLLPLSFKIPETVLGESKVIGIISPQAINGVIKTASDSADHVKINLITVWIAGVLMLFAFRIIRYAIFCRTLKKKSKRDFDFNLRFSVRRCRIKSPVMTGLFKPTLFIPKTLEGTELDFVIAHESVHYNRHDIVYKWFAVLMQTVHWFNPVSFLILRQIDEDCEISCDYEVSKMMSDVQRKDYMNLILSMASKRRILTTQMADSKSLIKKRFSAIISNPHKKMVVLPCVVAMGIAASSLCASGVAAGIKVPEKISVTKHSNKQSKISASAFVSEPKLKNEAKVSASDFAEKSELAPYPEYAEENESVHTPVAKTPDKATENTEAIQEVTEDNGYLPGDLIINEISAPPSGGDILSYDSDIEDTQVVTVIPGDNGMVSIHFGCDMPSAVAEISISGLSEDCDTVGYSVPTNSAYRYDICGLEPGKEYEIGINTYCPGNYDINGNITIIKE